MAWKLGFMDAASEGLGCSNFIGEFHSFVAEKMLFTPSSQTPLRDIASALDIRITEIKESHYDDPSLALLFSQLKSKTLQAAKGTSEISGRAEFNFVLQIARVFCRMGVSLFSAA